MSGGNDILVVGAGVIGLTCGIALAESGHRVTVRAERRTPNTTSDLAGAIFFPIEIERTNDRVLPWCRASLEAFRRLAESTTETGVAWIDVVELFAGDPGDPWWASIGLEFHPLDPSELPDGYGFGRVIRAPRIDMPTYLEYLEANLVRAGGRFEARRVESLVEDKGFAAVVNCSGLGARELCADRTVHPIRGQVVHVPWSESLRASWGARSFLDDEGPNALAYGIPREDVLVLGGTHEVEDGRTDADDAATRAILRRCAAIAPELDGASGDVHVGLRPGRFRVRLDREIVDDVTVVHCYGHGPLGVTLSWGCAAEVIDLV